MKQDKFLLEVEDCFLLGRRGLLVLASLSPPDGFRPFSSQVRVERPDQDEIGVTVEYFIPHILYKLDVKPENIACPSIHMLLREATEEMVPIGSKLYVSAEDHEKLKGQEAD